MLTPGYKLRQGSGLDRALLVQFMQRTYAELYPEQNFSHLAQTVEQYFSSDTQLWWIEMEKSEVPLSQSSQSEPQAEAVLSSDSSASVTSAWYPVLLQRPVSPVACLWMGTAIDQVMGWRYPHIFLLYVSSPHRRRGLGSALMRHAEAWARANGSHQIGLQVFQHNQPAQRLYESLGYQVQALAMVKPIELPL